MLGLLRRHEVQVLLKDGHKRTEVSRLTGISHSSVQRISAEATTEQFDDTAERLKRRIGRPSIVKGFWETISDILEKQPDLPSSDILRQVQNSRYMGQDRPSRGSGVESLPPRRDLRNNSVELGLELFGGPIPDAKSGRTFNKSPPILLPCGTQDSGNAPSAGGPLQTGINRMPVHAIRWRSISSERLHSRSTCFGRLRDW